MEEAIRILVVDDEPDIRRICRILLETGGYTVLEAATGAEAVEQVRQHPELDLILMDIMMPELGGYDACSRIRSYSTAPVLFLTAKTQEGDKRRAYDSGGDDFLAKPFSHAELMMKVESLLRRYRVYKSKSSGRTLRPGHRARRGKPPRTGKRPAAGADGDGVFHSPLSGGEPGPRRAGAHDLRDGLARDVYAGVKQYCDGAYREPAQEAGGGSGESAPDPHRLGKGLSD